MESIPLISIIIPVYNVSQFLDKCLLSVINQTYKNIEIIIVNDGSTDDSREIIEKYYLNDNRIKVVDKLNGGLASARNAGVKIAQGDYIWHIDSDDYVDLNSLNKMVSVALEQQSDIVVTGYKLVDFDYKEYDSKTVRFSGSISGTDALIRMLNHEIGGEVWTKLYKRSIYVDNNIIQDEEYSHVEDVMLNYQVFNFANKVTACNEFTVFHVLRKGSYSDSSKTTNFLYYHHKGLLKMKIYGFKNKNVENSYYAFLFRDFLQIFRSGSLELINRLTIDRKTLKKYLDSIVFIPTNYIKQKKILLILYPLIVLGFSNFIAFVLFIYIKRRFH